MSKLKAWIKEVKLAASVVKIIIAIAGCLSTALPIFQYIVRQEIAPVVQYIYSDIEKLIVKNAAKIAKDPGDVKIEDVETSLNYWPMLEEAQIVNKESLLQKIKILQDWYRENSA